MAGVLSELLQPLHGIDVASLYLQFGPLLDLMLYGAFFTSVAWVTVGRIYNHRGLAVALGLILTASLTLTAPVLGFSLKSFGPFAAGLIVLFVAIFVYRLLRQAELDQVAALCLSLVVTYLGLLIYSPQFVVAVNRVFPFGGLLVVAAIAVLLYRAALWITGWSAYEHRSTREQTSVQLSGREPLDRAERDNQYISRDLSALTQVLRRQPIDSQMAGRLQQELRNVKQASQDLMAQLDAVRLRAERLENFDRRFLRQYRHLPAKKQGELHELIRTRLHEKHVSHRLRQHTHVVEKLERHLTKWLAAAQEALANGDRRRAVASLTRCRRLAGHAGRRLQRLQQFEDELKNLPQDLQTRNFVS